MAKQESPAVKKKRIISIDYLRGIAIVIMALDHIREFFTSARFSPTYAFLCTGLYFSCRHRGIFVWKQREDQT